MNKNTIIWKRANYSYNGYVNNKKVVVVKRSMTNKTSYTAHVIFEQDKKEEAGTPEEAKVKAEKMFKNWMDTMGFTFK